MFVGLIERYVSWFGQTVERLILPEEFASFEGFSNLYCSFTSVSDPIWVGYTDQETGI